MSYNFDESQFSKEALQSFFDGGVLAYKRGKNMSDNPYPFATAAFKYWENGWWKTFYKETTFFVENLSAISSDEKIEDSFTEQSKYGDDNVRDLAFERKKREAKKNDG